MTAKGAVPGGSPRVGWPRILVSACLLGEKVRYDGGHRRDAFLSDALGRFVEYVPVCPEVGCGLPVPREPMRLAGGRSGPRLVTVGSGLDHTARMARFTAARLRELARHGLCGYVCKGGSPSCGMKAGLFTTAFAKRFPSLPVVEEGRLLDPVLREMFVENVFTTKRFHDAAARGRGAGALVAFHADHELLLLGRGRQTCKEMAGLVARAQELPAALLFARYRELLAKALALRPTRAKRSHALARMAGRLGRELSAAGKGELRELIARYRRGLVPLGAPMACLQDCARRLGVSRLARQAALDPHPAGLGLLDTV